MTNLTAKEEQMMRELITTSFYENGFESTLWIDTMLEEISIPVKSGRAVFASLVKKELLDSNGESFTLSESGIEWMKSNTAVDEEGYLIKDVAEKVSEEPVKTTKKASAKKAQKVNLYTFTGMDLGIYDIASETTTTITIIGKKGELVFNKKTLTQTNAKNAKFANKITLI